jgi:hypothetical protein
LDLGRLEKGASNRNRFLYNLEKEINLNSQKAQNNKVIG